MSLLLEYVVVNVVRQYWSNTYVKIFVEISRFFGCLWVSAGASVEKKINILFISGGLFLNAVWHFRRRIGFFAICSRA